MTAEKNLSELVPIVLEKYRQLSNMINIDWAIHNFLKEGFLSDIELRSLYSFKIVFE